MFAALVVLKHLVQSGTLCTSHLRIFEEEWMELAAESQRKYNPFTLRCVCQDGCHVDKAHINENYTPIGPLWPGFILDQLRDAKVASNDVFPTNGILSDDTVPNDSEHVIDGRCPSDNDSSHKLDDTIKLCRTTDLSGVKRKAREGYTAAFSNVRPVAALDEWATTIDTFSSFPIDK